jgi:NAD(P)-dependent dehydrogenase (short-subunit alcohol dehydrogenase family)
MKMFVTGASRYIGKVVVEHAVRAGHVVEGLARNQESAAKVSRLGPLQFQETCSRLVCWPLQLRVRTRSCIWRTFMTSASITPS